MCIIVGVVQYKQLIYEIKINNNIKSKLIKSRKLF